MDARSLLKAKRLERGAPTKQRIAPVRRENASAAPPKRKLETSASHNIPSPSSGATPSAEGPDGKRRRIAEGEAQSSSSSAFPADFFSDVSRAIPISSEDEDENDNESSSHLANQTHSTPPESQFITSQPLPSTSIDDEYEAFQRAIQKAAQPKPPDPSTIARATITAEAELFEEVPAGFPPSVLDRNDEGAPSSAAAADLEEDETEIDKFKRKELEDRELVIDRLLEEERAQEDADSKVSALKARLEAIKQKRAARKAGG